MAVDPERRTGRARIWKTPFSTPGAEHAASESLPSEPAAPGS
jgi:hypothetical protein